MQGTFGAFHDICDVVQFETRAQLAQIPRDDVKGASRLFLPTAHEAGAYDVVYDLAKGPSGSTRFRPQRCGNVIIERECYAHTVLVSALSIFAGRSGARPDLPHMRPNPERARKTRRSLLGAERPRLQPVNRDGDGGPLLQVGIAFVGWNDPGEKPFERCRNQ